MQSGKLKVIFISVALLLVGACTSNESKVGGMLGLNTNLKLEFKVADNINPDEKRTPSPVYLRFYELKSDKQFNKTDFLELYERDTESLGDDLVSKQELKRIAPGEAREEKFVLDKETRYVALFAEFFQYKDAKYKVVFPVTSSNIFDDRVLIEISGNTLSLVSKK